jgi:hypothetical protein
MKGLIGRIGNRFRGKKRGEGKFGWNGMMGVVVAG